MPEAHPMKILIPVDESLPVEAIGESLLPLIRTGPVHVTLLHVAEPSGPSRGIQAQLHVQREALQAHGACVVVRIVCGKPAEEILRCTASGDFDLLAMTTHGRRGLDRVMMGSVAEEVLRASAVPTLLCRTGIQPRSWTRIVVALDGLPGAEEVLEEVRTLATRLGATVHLVQVGLNLLRCNSYRGVTFDAPEEHSDYLDQIATRLLAQGIPVTTDHRVGLAGHEIALFAQELEAGLICMTTHGHAEEIPGLNRSVAAEVMQQAPCPVYVRRMSGAPCAK